MARREDQNRRRRLVRAYIRSIKRSVACLRCGESDWRCLDFHHLDPAQKTYVIARMPVDGHSLDVIHDEIAKCIPLCANCHRKETHDVDMTVTEDELAEFILNEAA